MGLDDDGNLTPPEPVQLETTLEELIACGAARAAKDDRLPLPTVVEEFLKLGIERQPEYDGLTKQKQAEIDRERLGFYKAQEKLREFIALVGKEAVANLADVRTEQQIRPVLMGQMRLWGVTD